MFTDCTLAIKANTAFHTHTFRQMPVFCILSSITNKMQRDTIFFITANALHVSGPSSGAQNCTHSIWYMPSKSYSFELLMMGGKPA
jgi:hypothetical protein